MIDVPNAPGVPPLPGGGAVVDTTAAPLTGDGVSTAQVPGPQWGIFDQNSQPVITGDAVVSLEMLKEARISNYPIQQGSFASYNKVFLPYQARIQISKGGSIGDRETFLSNIETAFQSDATYNISTPEQTYINAEVAHYTFDRSAQKGANMITADIWLEEVRTTATEAFSQTVNPLSAPASDTGAVQGQPPTDAQGTIIATEGMN
jgi:hypothetical protein